ncbi:MAG: peptidoglycan DD-metalloendopeptidase family protein [Spirochaetia bacterium]
MMSVIEAQSIKRRGRKTLSRINRRSFDGGDVIDRIRRFKATDGAGSLLAAASQRTNSRRQTPNRSSAGRRLSPAYSAEGVRTGLMPSIRFRVTTLVARYQRKRRLSNSSVTSNRSINSPAIGSKRRSAQAFAFNRAQFPGLQTLVNGAGGAVGTGAHIIVGAIAEKRRDLDIAFFTAVALTAFLIAQTMGPGSLFEQLLVSRSVYGLPQTEEIRGVLSNYIEPRNEFDVIGEDIQVDPAQFSALEVSEYRLAAGDTLSAIASRNDLRIDTLVSFNQLDDVRRMQIGQELRIPNRDGLLYTVRRGDTLESIALSYGTSATAILDANDLLSTNIRIGELLFVPDARMNQTELAIVLGDAFRWPAQGRFTSGFGMRRDPFTGIRRFHNGIDLANVPGSRVVAAMSGTVVHIESQPGNYGRFVIIRHDKGYQTLYAHLHAWSVRVGQRVTQGQSIGSMGNTGRSTGPHLHFSIIRNGTFVDPMRYLN